MTLHSRRLFTLCSYLDHVSILAAEFKTIDTTDDIAFDAINLNNNNQCIIVCFLVVFFRKKNYLLLSYATSVRPSVSIISFRSKIFKFLIHGITIFIMIVKN